MAEDQLSFTSNSFDGFNESNQNILHCKCPALNVNFVSCLGDVNLPAIKAGNGNHWQPKKRQVVEAMIGDRVSAVEGTKIFIKCLFGGKPEPRATWYIGERRIDNQRRLPYSYSYKDYVTTLEIPKMKKYLAGTYACRIENRYGVVKAYSEVRILSETAILISSIFVRYMSFINIKLLCIKFCFTS